MTKYFKLLGVALIATSLALVSCKEDPQGTDDPGIVNPEPEPDPDPEPPTTDPNTVNVTFGSDSYQPAISAAAYSAANGYYGFISLKDQSSSATNRIQFYSAATTVGSANGTLAAFLDWGSEILMCEYFLVEEDLVTFDGQTYHGDYWAKTVTATISAIDLNALTLSVNVNAEMVNVWDIVDAEGYFDAAALAAAPTTPMLLSIGNYQMEDMDAMKSSLSLNLDDVKGSAKKAIVR